MLFARASQQVPDFTTISLRLPNPPANTLTFSIDRGNGGRPDLRSQLTLDRATGEIVRWEAFSGFNRGRQLRAWARFTHTGEAGGWLGQTIAVIATAGASLLVFTGLSLAVRRLFAWKGRRVKVLTICWSLANPVFSLQFSVLSCSPFVRPCVCLPCYNALPYRTRPNFWGHKNVSLLWC